jgi:iron complex transport system ATP-binding protein
MTVPPPLFDFQSVTVNRGDIRALDRITLSIGVGEHVAILGPNGSGKSTLIKTFTRECYPVVTEDRASGLRIMGHQTWSVTTLRSMLGIVTNDLVAECTRGRSGDIAEFGRRVTGRDTVLSGFFSSIGLWRHHQVTPEMGRKADEVLARLEISHLADRPLHEVSSGEARRVVIGRALVHNPTALVLDEVANSLDLRATHQLRELIRTIAQAGTTIVLVTHHLPEIIPEIGRVVLLDRGRVVDDGPKGRLLTSASLARLFGAPVEVGQHEGYFHAW